MDQDQSTLFQAAISETDASLNRAERRYQDSVLALQNVDQSDLLKRDSAQREYDAATTAVAQANRDRANLLVRVSNDSRQRVRTDPAQQQMWQNRANDLAAQAELHQAQADRYTAKTDADITAANARAQKALQDAASSAARLGSQNARDNEAAALSKARAAAIESLTPTLVEQHRALITLAAANTQRAAALTARTQYDTDVLDPARAQRYLAAAGYSQAQIDALNVTTPVKVAALAAKAGLDDARARQVYANLDRWQQAPSQDASQPNLLEFQASTGSYRATKNPIYRTDTERATADEQQSISALQQQLADGTIQPDEASQLLDNIRTSTRAKSLGLTPEQYSTQQQKQAAFGQGMLDTMQTQGNTMAGDLLTTATKGQVRGLGGMAFTPYQNAQSMGGGAQAIQMALGLLRQIQPVSNRMQALDAVSKWAGAKALVAAAQQQGGGQTSSQPDSGTNVDLSKAGFSGYGTPGGYRGAQNPNLFGGATTGGVPAQPQQQPDFAAQSINDPSRSYSNPLVDAANRARQF